MKIVLSFFILLFSFKIVYACKPGEFVQGETKEVISVFCDADFREALDNIKKEFENKNPEVIVYIISKASRELGYMIREGSFKPRVDIIISSSAEVIESLLFPDLIDWYIVFGRDELCLAYTQGSKFANQINTDNWYKVISQEGVKLARVDENLDPLGYRTLFTWKLADIYYKEKIFEIPVGAIYPKGENLILSLKAGDVDYAFTYLSIAKEKGLNYIRLPPEINLADTRFSSFYEQAIVDVSGKERAKFLRLNGRPITYSIGFLKSSITKGWPKKFFNFLFFQEAKAIFKKTGIEFDTLHCKGNIPKEFKDLCPQNY